MTARGGKDLPRNQTVRYRAQKRQPEQSQKHVPVKNAPARSPLSGQSALRVCGLYECAGMERLGEHDGEGGWVGGGRGGAKGEP